MLIVPTVAATFYDLSLASYAPLFSSGFSDSTFWICFPGRSIWADCSFLSIYEDISSGNNNTSHYTSGQSTDKRDIQEQPTD